MNDREILRKIEREIAYVAQEQDIFNLKIARVKALKKIQPMGLKEAKEWVEDHYLDNGYGKTGRSRTPLLYVEWRGRRIIG